MLQSCHQICCVLGGSSPRQSLAHSLLTPREICRSICYGNSAMGRGNPKEMKLRKLLSLATNSIVY